MTALIGSRMLLSNIQGGPKSCTSLNHYIDETVQNMRKIKRISPTCSESF